MTELKHVRSSRRWLPWAAAGAALVVAQAGLRPDDVITSIAGKPATGHLPLSGERQRLWRLPE